MTRPRRQLALSEGTLRGRLSPARKRLRSQLTRRGVTVPAALLAAGASTQVHAAVPTHLVRSTTQIALQDQPRKSAASAFSRGEFEIHALEPAQSRARAWS